MPEPTRVDAQSAVAPRGGKRYPLRPLLDATSTSVHELADLTRTDRAQMFRWMHSGLLVDIADRLAIRAGTHPASVWADWREDSLSDIDRLYPPSEHDWWLVG